MRIAIDATYGVGRQLTGVGVYSRELIAALRRSDGAEWRFCFRPHRVLRGLVELGRARTRLLTETHVPACDLFHGLNQRLPAAKLRRRVVTFHDLFVMTGEYSTPEFRSRFTEQARAAAARSDLIIAVSRFTGDQVRDLLGVPQSRIRVIHHGTRAEPVGQFETAGREPLILHVGAIQTRKNVVRLVEAFERTPPEWRLVLAGSHGFGAEGILARIERSRRREHVRITGYVSARELNKLYRRASIFAFPSLDEGFGMPVLDAMARGVPVLTSNGSALREVAGDAAVLVDPQKTDEITAALLRLCEDSELRRNLAALGRARSATFTWDVAAKKTWTAYRELLG